MHVLRIVVIAKVVCLEVSYLNGTAARNASVFDALPAENISKNIILYGRKIETGRVPNFCG